MPHDGPHDDVELVFSSITSRLRARARERPEHLALLQDDRSVSYGEFDAAVDRVAATLQVEGLQPQDVLAVCAGSSIPYLEVFFGALRVGLVVAPLAPTSSVESLAVMVADCGAKILFADAATWEYLAPARDDITATVIILDDEASPSAFESWLAPKDVEPTPVVIEPNWPFDIIYSSGTTGTPKGIVQPHLMRTPYDPVDEPFGYGPDAITIISTGLYSNTTLTSVFPTLGSGGTLVLMAKFDARTFLELAQRWRATHAMLVPVQYQRILADPAFDGFDLSAFQMKFVTSAPFAAALKAEVLRRWPGGLTEYYGMTEGGVGTVLYAHENPDKLHTVGRPWPFNQVRLINDDGQEIAPGEKGEIVGTSPMMMIGYHNQPNKTFDAIWHGPDGQMYVRTGDIGRFDEDGFLILMDRKKDMIISGGFNVYPSDLEMALRNHPEVADAAVVGVPSATWGETPVGFVTLVSGSQATGEGIRSAVNAKMGKVQRIATIQVIDELPRSHIGKIMKRELREAFLTSGEVA